MPASAETASSLASWQRAAAFAARKHQHQFRKDERTPYVSHVYRVAMTVRHVFNCGDPAILVAALLHDTIEDTTTDFDELSEHFGEDVAALVAALTKNMALPDAQREAEYDARLAKADWRARLIKLADVFDNLSDYSPETGMRRQSVLDKCARALELASGDMHRPEIATAAAAVRAAMTA
jgi:(p)ppGpp synthase/HD superfamily hydrolase